MKGRAGEMALQVKALANKPTDLDLIPGTQIVGGKNSLCNVVL